MYASQASSQRKDEKTVRDLRVVVWVLGGAFFFYVVVFHYLANLPLDVEPLYVLMMMMMMMMMMSIFICLIISAYLYPFPIPLSLTHC